MEEMSSIASERLSRLRLDLRGIARLLRSPALRALVGAHLIVAGIIEARSDGGCSLSSS